MTPVAALFRFHLRSGARLAMRAGVPAAALLTAAIGLSPDPGATLQRMASDLAGTSGGFGTSLLLAAIGAAIAAWAAPRVGHGVVGWVRHLPAAGRDHGRALLGALVAAQTPVAVAWVGLWLAAWYVGTPVELHRLVSLPAVLAAIGLVFLPSRRRGLLVVCGLVALALALAGGWIGIFVAAFVTAALSSFFAPRRPGALKGFLGHTTVRARWIPGLIASRAVGWRLLGAWAGGGIALVAAALFVNNNPEVPTGGPLRFAAGCAVALVLSGLAEPLATRRPPWRWARSLPWSAADRVLHDAAWFAGHLLVVPLVLAVALDARAALAVVLIVPLLSVRAASALRRRKPAAGTGGIVFGESLFAATLLGVSAWAALAALVLVWPAWREAASRDRDLDVSRWSPREHLAAGDPASWRGG